MSVNVRDKGGKAEEGFETSQESFPNGCNKAHTL